ncbi:aromatic ring-hydroxylating dioxygenase subunit alpha [Leekyejoonella antrihumi]|nr:aromatic ring-hydroxylating dioxygenase subunit alpha [Leekyejoonella antrihumi]
MSAIFTSHWLFVASVAEIPEPGDYVTVDLGLYSVILIRGDGGEVQALHNVCRHRGSKVLNDTSGSVGNIVCGYHKWTYATDGSLLHAESPAKDFDASCFGLKPVHLKNAGGLLFICLADEPPADFDEVAATVEPYLAVHDIAHTKVAAQIDIIEEGNWKLVMENNRECYHCDGHPQLICSLFPLYGYSEEDVTKRLRPVLHRYQAAEAQLRETCAAHAIPVAVHEELDTRVSGYRIARLPLDGAGESFSQDGRSICRKLLGTAPTARLGHLALHLQPNSWFHFLGDHAVTFSVLPLGPSKSLLRTTWLVHEDAVEGEDYDLAELTRVWQATNTQDVTFVARTQLGVTNPRYEGGPYSPTEYQVEAFVNWYIKRLEHHLQAS